MSSTIQESLWLVCAMDRHGLDNWGAVAKQLNSTCKGYGYQRSTRYTAEYCHRRYLTVQQNFKICYPNEENNCDEGSLVKAMMKHYNELRQAELRFQLNGEKSELLDAWTRAEEQMKKDEKEKQMAMQNVLETVRTQGNAHLFETKPPSEKEDGAQFTGSQENSKSSTLP